MQQQQSNMVKPQKVGGTKKGMVGKTKQPRKSAGGKMPTRSKVESSLRKTMGY